MNSDFHLSPKFQLDSPYLADYFGIWSIHEPLFRALAERCNGMDLLAHVQSSEVRQSVAERDHHSFQRTDDGIAIIQVRGAMMKTVSWTSGATASITAIACSHL